MQLGAAPSKRGPRRSLNGAAQHRQPRFVPMRSPVRRCSRVANPSHFGSRRQAKQKLPWPLQEQPSMLRLPRPRRGLKRRFTGPLPPAPGRNYHSRHVPISRGGRSPPTANSSIRLTRAEPGSPWLSRKGPRSAPCPQTGRIYGPEVLQAFFTTLRMPGVSGPRSSP